MSGDRQTYPHRQLHIRPGSETNHNPCTPSTTQTETNMYPCSHPRRETCKQTHNTITQSHCARHIICFTGIHNSEYGRCILTHDTLSLNTFCAMLYIAHQVKIIFPFRNVILVYGIRWIRQILADGIQVIYRVLYRSIRCTCMCAQSRMCVCMDVCVKACSRAEYSDCLLFLPNGESGDRHSSLPLPSKSIRLSNSAVRWSPPFMSPVSQVRGCIVCWKSIWVGSSGVGLCSSVAGGFGLLAGCHTLDAGDSVVSLLTRNIGCEAGVCFGGATFSLSPEKPIVIVTELSGLCSTDTPLGAATTRLGCHVPGRGAAGSAECSVVRGTGCSVVRDTSSRVTFVNVELPNCCVLVSVVMCRVVLPSCSVCSCRLTRWVGGAPPNTPFDNGCSGCGTLGGAAGFEKDDGWTVFSFVSNSFSTDSILPASFTPLEQQVVVSRRAPSLNNGNYRKITYLVTHAMSNERMELERAQI